MTLYPQKITFGEMRASRVRDVLVYCRDHNAATTSRSAPTAGPIMCSCRTSNAVSCARYAASAVPRCGRIFRRRMGTDAYISFEPFPVRRDVCLRSGRPQIFSITYSYLQIARPKAGLLHFSPLR